MNYIVRIPEPCHEDWNKMEINEKGRHCQVCSKSVIDFTSKSDEEIYTFLKASENEKVCGRLMKLQIDRPITMSLSLKNAPSNMSVTRVFAYSLLLVFGAFLFSCTNDEGNKINKIEMDQFTQGVMQLPPLKTGEDSIVNQVQTVEGEMMVNGGMIGEFYQQDTISNIPLVEIIEPIKNDYPVAGGLMYVQHDVDIVPLVDVNKEDSLANRVTNPLTSSEFVVFPNPSNGEFTLSYEIKKKERVTILIYSMNGTLIQEPVKSIYQHSGHYKIPLNLTELANGIYLCKIIKGDKEEHQQIVISK